MTASFQKEFEKLLPDLNNILSSDNSDWTVKGFIDIYKNIYTISLDTKVISKILELMIFPSIQQFAIINNYTIVLSEHQNHYPDITFIDIDGNKIALDIKSTYRTLPNRVNGFTLGAFTGYFRQRHSTKNVTYPYNDYTKHYVLGIIYSKQSAQIDERKIYSLNELSDVLSVIHNFEFIFQEKYRIATDRPGSGNTKNIGSINSIKALKSGKGLFYKYGEKIFNDYWMNYLTNDMAKLVELDKPPYSNFKEYLNYKNLDKKTGENEQ